MALIPCNPSQFYDDSKRCYDQAHFRLIERWAGVCFGSTVLQKTRYENFFFKTQNNKLVRPQQKSLRKENNIRAFVRNSK